MEVDDLKRVLCRVVNNPRQGEWRVFSLRKLFNPAKVTKRHVKTLPMLEPAYLKPRRPRTQPMYMMPPEHKTVKNWPMRVLTGARHLIRQFERDQMSRNVDRAYNRFSLLRNLPDGEMFLSNSEGLISIDHPAVYVEVKNNEGRRGVSKLQDYAVYKNAEYQKKHAGAAKGKSITQVVDEIVRTHPVIVTPDAYQPEFRSGLVMPRSYQYSSWHGSLVWSHTNINNSDPLVHLTKPVSVIRDTIYTGKITLPGVVINSFKCNVNIERYITSSQHYELVWCRLRPDISPFYLKLVQGMRNRIKGIGRKILRFPYEAKFGKFVPRDVKKLTLQKRRYIAHCSRLVFKLMRQFTLKGHNARTWLRGKIGDEKYRILRRNLRVMRRRQFKHMKMASNARLSSKLRKKGLKRQFKRNKRRRSEKYLYHISKKNKKSVFRKPRHSRLRSLRRSRRCCRANSMKAQNVLDKRYHRKIMRKMRIIARPGSRVHPK